MGRKFEGFINKGNWLSVNDKNMLVMISPLKSNFPQAGLQEIACRCHGVFINLYRAVGSQESLYIFLRQSSCTHLI
jgi:hypothetical protein